MVDRAMAAPHKITAWAGSTPQKTAWAEVQEMYPPPPVEVLAPCSTLRVD